jgi:arsenate reductase (thioredoxin)
VKILFLCVANSARSQLAEGLAKSMFGKNAVIESAGSEPSGVVQPWAVKVLSEDGIDISGNISKSFEDLPKDFLESLDFVITLCAEEVCPAIITTANRLHWPIPDPASVPENEKREAFTAAQNTIRTKLYEFARANNLMG